MAKQPPEQTPPAAQPEETIDTIPVPSLGSEPPAGQIPLTSEPGAPAPVKGKRHRRTKAQIEAERAKLGRDTVPEGPAVSPEDRARCVAGVAVIFGVAGKLVSKWRGSDVWDLDPEQAQTLGEAWTTVIEPYLPMIGEAMPVVAALAVTWSVVQPKWDAEQEEKARRRNNEPQHPVVSLGVTGA